MIENLCSKKRFKEGSTTRTTHETNLPYSKQSHKLDNFETFTERMEVSKKHLDHISQYLTDFKAILTQFKQDTKVAKAVPNASISEESSEDESQ